MSFSFPSNGTNPLFGQDTGPAPPCSNQMPMLGNMGAGVAQPMYSYANGPPPPGLAYTMQLPYQPYQPYQPYPPYGQAWAATTGPDGQPNWFRYSSGTQGSSRMPQPHPVINPDMPAANLTNSTGGLGCEPGYNYFFDNEHTKVHVLKSGATPPWQLPPHFTIPFHASHVPCSTTVERLMQGFGATNPNPKKNKLYEVTRGGNGRWYKGLMFRGNMKEMMKKTVKELGWDRTRTGLPGGKPVVYLYLTKD